MKYLALALGIAGCMASLSYCQIQSEANSHDLVMWCLQHNGHINNWTNQCELRQSTTKLGGE